VRRARACAQGSQAHELGQVADDDFERAAATGAQVVEVICRGPIAPCACRRARPLEWAMVTPPSPRSPHPRGSSARGRGGSRRCACALEPLAHVWRHRAGTGGGRRRGALASRSRRSSSSGLSGPPSVPGTRGTVAARGACACCASPALEGAAFASARPARSGSSAAPTRRDPCGPPIQASAGKPVPRLQIGARPHRSR
jgi:hypothetical protein